jgi:hypothetical protein
MFGGFWELWGFGGFRGRTVGTVRTGGTEVSNMLVLVLVRVLDTVRRPYTPFFSLLPSPLSHLPSPLF